VLVVEGMRGYLMAEGDEGLADLQMTKAGGKMKIGVRETVSGVIGVMKEVGMGVYDALDQ
jgi:hypothetical protein